MHDLNDYVRSWCYMCTTQEVPTKIFMMNYRTPNTYLLLNELRSSCHKSNVLCWELLKLYIDGKWWCISLPLFLHRDTFITETFIWNYKRFTIYWNTPLSEASCTSKHMCWCEYVGRYIIPYTVCSTFNNLILFLKPFEDWWFATFDVY